MNRIFGSPDGKLVVLSSSTKLILQPTEKADSSTILKKCLHPNAMFHRKNVILLPEDFSSSFKPLVKSDLLCRVSNLGKFIPI